MCVRTIPVLQEVYSPIQPYGSTLNRLLGKDVEYKWTSVQNDAFMELREGPKNALFMNYSTANGKFTLISDASKASTRLFIESKIGRQGATFDSMWR